MHPAAGPASGCGASLDIEDEESNAFGEDEVRLLTAVADQLGSALHIAGAVRAGGRAGQPEPDSLAPTLRRMRRILIVGSTGSIGTQALDVVSRSDALEVVGLAAGSNADLLLEQARQFGVDTRRARRPGRRRPRRRGGPAARCWAAPRAWSS